MVDAAKLPVESSGHFDFFSAPFEHLVPATEPTHERNISRNMRDGGVESKWTSTGSPGNKHAPTSPGTWVYLIDCVLPVVVAINHFDNVMRAPDTHIYDA